MDRAKICAARSRADLACRDRRFGGDSGVESALAGARPGGGQPIRPARRVRSDRARRDHESVGHRAGRSVAGRGADPGPHVPRQRNGGAAGLRLRAGAAAGAVVLFCRGHRRRAWAGWRSSRCRAPTAKCSCCANRRSRRRNSASSTPADSARFSGGDAVFYAERVDQEGVLHNVFVQREIGRANRSGARRHRHLFQGRAERHAPRDAVQRPAL